MRIFDDYDVDKDGNVYSYKSKKYLTPQLNRYGYLYVTIKSKHFPVHRLVALAFLENKDNKPCIDHIDTNKLNNHYSNLRYVTHKENSNNKNTICRLKNIGVKYKTQYGKKIIDKSGKLYHSIIEASRETNIPRSNIQYHLKNNTGRWRYVQEVQRNFKSNAK